MSDAFGQWTSEDIRSLAQLCRRARQSDEPEPGGPPAVSDDAPVDLAMARQTLHSHPIYRWLKTNAQRALMVNVDEFRLVATLLRCIVIHFAVPTDIGLKPDEADKKRSIVMGAIDRVQRAMVDGMIIMDNPEKTTVLSKLLDEATAGLSQPGVKSADSPALAALGSALIELHVTEAAVITSMAAALGIQCDVRTAQRYLKADRLP